MGKTNAGDFMEKMDENRERKEMQVRMAAMQLEMYALDMELKRQQIELVKAQVRLAIADAVKSETR